ncbi:MAG: hypothetical protein AB7C90_01065 [Bacteroidales bacterium]
MKNMLLYVGVLLFGTLSVSCSKDEDSGSVASNAVVGSTISSVSSSAGVSNIEGIVTSVTDGVSSYAITATVTNPTVIAVLEDMSGVAVSGNTVSMASLRLKVTTKGIEAVSGFEPGVIVKYSDGVGKRYPINGTNRYREVVSKSTENDFMWYGFMQIKVMEVVESESAIEGIKSITYWCNHAFGMVAIKVTFDDDTWGRWLLNGMAPVDTE